MPPPLGELYDLLRSDGFVIGIDDHVRIGRLLARDAEWTLADLHTAVGALVVKHVEQQATFDACWRLWLADGSRRSAAPPDRVEPTVDEPPRSRVLGIAALAAIAALAVVIAWWLRDPAGDDPVATASDAAVDGGVALIDAAVVDGDSIATAPTDSAAARDDAGAVVVTPRDAIAITGPVATAPAFTGPDVEPPGPLERPLAAWLVLAAIVIGGGLIVIAGAKLARGALRRRRYVPGPWRYKLAVPPPRIPFVDADVIVDAAADLTLAGDVAGDELDLDRTVARTTASGGAPTLVYKPPPPAPEYIVLEDIAAGSERWRPLYDELWRGLAREGVRLARFTFVATADTCEGADGKPAPLHDVLSHADALIVVGDAAAAVDAFTGAPAEWLASIRQIPRRLWLNPTPPALWSVGARHVARETPMEHGAGAALVAIRDGLARRAIAPRPLPASVVRTPAAPTAIAALRAYLGERPFRLLAAMAAIGTTRLDAARWLAGELAIEIDELDWLALVSIPWVGRAWPDGTRAAFTDALAVDAPALHERVLALGDRLLAASEPAHELGAHLRWELDVAGRAVARGDDRAFRTIARLRETPLHTDADDELAQLGVHDRSGRVVAALVAAGLALAAVGIARSPSPAARVATYYTTGPSISAPVRIDQVDVDRAESRLHIYTSSDTSTDDQRWQVRLDKLDDPMAGMQVTADRRRVELVVIAHADHDPGDTAGVIASLPPGSSHRRLTYREPAQIDAVLAGALAAFAGHAPQVRRRVLVLGTDAELAGEPIRDAAARGIRFAFSVFALDRDLATGRVITMTAHVDLESERSLELAVATATAALGRTGKPEFHIEMAKTETSTMSHHEHTKLAACRSCHVVDATTFAVAAKTPGHAQCAACHTASTALGLENCAGCHKPGYMDEWLDKVLADAGTRSRPIPTRPASFIRSCASAAQQGGQEGLGVPCFRHEQREHAVGCEVCHRAPANKAIWGKRSYDSIADLRLNPLFIDDVDGHRACGTSGCHEALVELSSGRCDFCHANATAGGAF